MVEINSTSFLTIQLLNLCIYTRKKEQLDSLHVKKSTLLLLDIGVIQGTVIGPLSFSMYSNDITKIGLNCKKNTTRRRHDVYFLAQKFSRIREKS